MTQHQLIIEYCKRFGRIIPAKLKEADRAAVPGGFIGSECIRRCQELVERGEMYRWPSEGKFAVYSVVPAPAPVLVANLAPRTIVHGEHPATYPREFCCVQNWRHNPHDPKCWKVKVKA